MIDHEATWVREALERYSKLKVELVIDLLRSGEPLSDAMRDVMADALLPKHGVGGPKQPWAWRLALHVDGLRKYDPRTGTYAGMSYEDAVAEVAEAHGVGTTKVTTAYSRLRKGQRELASSGQ